MDSRGNKKGVNAQFTPPMESLAYTTQIDGEIDLPEIWADPLPVVVNVLRKYRTYSDVWQNLPDIETWLTK